MFLYVTQTQSIAFEIISEAFQLDKDVYNNILFSNEN